jgi:hypothetical protein
MPTLTQKLYPAAGAALVAILSAHSVNAASLYTVTALPFKPSNLNDRGQVVGQNYLWNNGTVTDLNTLPGAGTRSLSATAINNQGQIVGGGLVFDPNPSSFVRSQGFFSDGTSITDLNLINEIVRQTNTFPGGETTAVDINEQGQILVNLERFSFDGQVSSYLRNPDGTIRTILGDGRGTALNNLGQATGYTISRGRSGPGLGLLWDNGNFVGLTSPGYCNAFFQQPNCRSFSAVMAYALNDVGQVVGVGPLEQGSSDSNALLWQSPLSSSRSSTVSDALVKAIRNPQQEQIGQDLGTLGGSVDRALFPYEPSVGIANIGINNAGQVVRSAFTPDGSLSAFLQEGNALFNLNSLIDPSLGWQLRSASKVNQQGQIIGVGLLNGQEQGFLLTQIVDMQTVPEAGFEKGLLLGAGAFGISALLRQTRRRKT